jgi:hypothetical protein
MVPERAAPHCLLPAVSLFVIIVIQRAEWKYIQWCNGIEEYHNSDEAEK